MMAHKNRLTAQEIASIVDYIRTKFMRNPTQLAGSVKNLKGEKTYTRHCSVCHGDKGNTAFWARNGLNPPPRNFTDPTVRRELSRERMIESVTHGRPGTGMMPFAKRLSAEEIRGVVSYIRDTFMQIEVSDSAQSTFIPSISMPEIQPGASLSEKVTESPQTMQPNPHQGSRQGVSEPPNALATAEPADMSLPFPVNLHGDVEEGRRFFMANCFTCHGVNGNGQGPRAYFNTPRPRDFRSEASRRMLNRVRLFTGIKNGRTGTVMPAWGKVLTDQQIADVAEFVLQTFILLKDDADVPTAKKNL
jgi:mono/diheme cytochrome c family protein